MDATVRNIFRLRAAEDQAALEGITRAQSLSAVLSSWNSYRGGHQTAVTANDLCHSSHLLMRRLEEDTEHPGYYDMHAANRLPYGEAVRLANGKRASLARLAGALDTLRRLLRFFFFARAEEPSG